VAVYAKLTDKLKLMPLIELSAAAVTAEASGNGKDPAATIKSTKSC